MKDLIRALTPRSLRNWVRQPKRSWQYISDRIGYRLRGACTVQIRSDWTVRCHPASVNHFTVFTQDTDQAKELEGFIQHCKSGMQFIDIGAHYGLFALAAARYGGATAKVVCVEASPAAAEILRENVSLNAPNGVVQIMNVAMGTEDGKLKMLSTGPAGSDYFVSAPPDRADTILVRQIALATAIKESGISPTHIKMDVEGFEDDVIRGGIEVLKHFRPTLFLELHGTYLRERHRDPAEVLRMLHECGYVRMEDNGMFLTDEAIRSLNFECRIICHPVIK